MKILQLTQRFPPGLGGVEEHVFQVSQRLARKGHEVIVFTSDLEKDRPLVRLPRDTHFTAFSRHLNVFRFKALQLFNLKHGVGVIMPRMLRATLKEKVDIIHAHGFGFWPTYVGMVKRLLDQTPLVITPHSNPGSKDYGVVDIRKLPLRRADNLIALTNLERKHLVHLGIHPNRISVIPNGLDLEKFKMLSNVSNENNIVLYVGKININHKGVDTLIKSVPVVLRCVPDARFLLVGPDWGDLIHLKRLAFKLRVQSHVSFIGAVSEQEKMKYFGMAEVCVVPSNIEPFGIVILEFMACGKPVIASRTGGIPEILKDKENGILVHPGNPKKLGDAISFVLQNKAVATRMGELGKKEAQKYTWDSVVDQIEKIYDEGRSVVS